MAGSHDRESAQLLQFITTEIHTIHDDDSAVMVDKGLAPSPWQAFMSTAGMVSVVTGVIGAAFAGVMLGASCAHGLRSRSAAWCSSSPSCC